MVTGDFTRETLNKLLREHKRNCINAVNGGLCNDFCENSDFKKLDDQSEYLIVGAVLSRQFDHQELGYKRELKQYTDFKESSKVISEQQMQRLLASSTTLKESEIDVLRSIKNKHA